MYRTKCMYVYTYYVVIQDNNGAIQLAFNVTMI